MEWQPIETAPKDGQRVLTFRSGFAESMAVAWFNNSGFGLACWVPVNGAAWPEPTHWMQLPEPPK
jgi:hypothetical protein